MTNKLCSIQYPPGARGDFLAVCIWLLYNNSDEKYNWEDACWISNRGKIMFTNRVIPSSKITKYSLDMAYNMNKPSNPFWQEHMEVERYLNGNNLFLKNMLTSCDVRKYVDEYLEDDREYPIIPLATHYAWTVSAFDNFLLYDEFLKDIGIVENIYILPENISEMLEMILLYNYKDFVDEHKDVKTHKEVILKIKSFIDVTRWVDKIDANTFSYSKIKTLSPPKLAKYIISKLGIQTTMNNQFIKFVEEYRRVSEKYESKLDKDVKEMYSDLMLQHESFKYSSEMIKRGEDEYRNRFRD